MRRAELHLRVGEALENAGSGRGPAELAHHFTAAAPLGGAARGVAYNVLAARAAVAALDFDEAAERLGVALDLGVADPRERAELLIELGTARHRAGRAVDALAAFVGRGDDRAGDPSCSRAPRSATRTRAGAR